MKLIRFGAEGSANDFGNSLLALSETMIELFTDRARQLAPSFDVATSGNMATFALSRFNFSTDPPAQARCAHVRVNQVIWEPFRDRFYYTVEIEFIGDASTKTLYGALLRMVADMPGAPRKELTDTADAYEGQASQPLATEQPIAHPAISPIEDPINLAILQIIKDADYEITDKEIAARLVGKGVPQIGRQAVNVRRNRLKASHRVR